MTSRQVRGENTAHTVPQHVKTSRLALADMTALNILDYCREVVKVILGLLNMARQALGAPKTAMIHRVHIETVRRQFVAHIDKPAAVRAQAMQQQEHILAPRPPGTQEKLTAISHRQRFGRSLHRSSRPHLSPLTWDFDIVKHESILPFLHYDARSNIVRIIPV